MNMQPTAQASNGVRVVRIHAHVQSVVGGGTRALAHLHIAVPARHDIAGRLLRAMAKQDCSVSPNDDSGRRARPRSYLLVNTCVVSDLSSACFFFVLRKPYTFWRPPTADRSDRAPTATTVADLWQFRVGSACTPGLRIRWTLGPLTSTLPPPSDLQTVT